jgi:PBP4 family serine-type D-alanyl-D-alanine carboxypeptidase
MIHRAWWAGLTGLLLAHSAVAQTPSLAQRIDRIADRPEFKGAVIGVKVESLDQDTTYYVRNGDQLFVPGSTTKLLTVGTALNLLGADYRFHTKVYRTGPVVQGTLRGDLILVASGDPNLSDRISGDSLLFVDEDHSYGSDPATDLVRGDPLAVMRELAGQVKRQGIRRITGRVLVDARLFTANQRELGTGVMLSPAVLNDNIVGRVVAPGGRPGAPASLTILPETPYAHIVNRIVTVAADSTTAADVASDSLRADGSRTVVLGGTIRLGDQPVMLGYKVPEPDRFLAAGLRRALADSGVTAAGTGRAGPPSLPGHYADDQVVAEHVSLPFRETAKVILKVSQNLHASMTPYVLGAVLKGATGVQAGFDLEHEMLSKAGLDLTGAVQSDGAGGAALFSPDFMVSYLRWMAGQPTFPAFKHGLPILGRDGTLAKISVDAPAAGHVFAKTGTFVDADLLNRGWIVQGKGLAGYMTTRSGHQLAFAIYLNRVKVSKPSQFQELVGQAAGDIAAAMYDAIP